jgi:sec-independent protein translocase protein TatA
MLKGAFEGWHIILILAVAVLLFGSAKLPGAARSMGQSLRIFKSELRAGAQDGQAQTQAQPAAAPQAVENKVVTQPVTDTVPQPAPVHTTIQP